MPHLRDAQPTAPCSSPCADDVVVRFVQRHQVALWRFLRVLGCRGAAAEEFTQDALLIALERGVHEGADDGAAAAFLRRTARHLWLRRQRDERRRAERHAEAAERVFERHLLRDGGDRFLDALEKCVAALPPRARLAIERTYRDGHGRAELARELGIGEHGVRTLLQRLRAGLRECIERRIQR